MDDQLKHKDELFSWLLEEENPGVRYLAMRDLLGSGVDNPVYRGAKEAAHKAGPIADILAKMNEMGYWERSGAGYNPKYRSAVWSLTLLAQLGADVTHDERIQRACDYLLAHGLAEGGQFSTTGAPSGTIDCLQGNLCWALITLGYRNDRLNNAFDWLSRSNTGDGISPQQEKGTGLRYYAYKCGPGFACGVNGGLPCAWGAVKVLLALGVCPQEYRTIQVEQATQQAVDFLFSVDPATAAYPSRDDGEPNRSWFKFGFPVFYITDVLQIVEALAGCGYARDARLANALEFILSKQDTRGRWSLEYDYSGKTWVNFGDKKKLNKWVTLRALRVLKAAGQF